MKNLLLLFLLINFASSYGQYNIEFINNLCPAEDVLSVCIGESNIYVGQYEYRTYDHFCGDEEFTGVVTLWRDYSGEFFVDDFSFGTWSGCFGTLPPTGTLRMQIECNTILGFSGTDNYGDVWETTEVEYTGTSVILHWVSTYPDYGSTELIPIDGSIISAPEVPSDPPFFLKYDLTLATVL